jgi:predicted transcriptional regulator
MTVNELCEKLGCAAVCGGAALERQVTGGYCGDLLSWVMGRAGSGSAWVTVIGNRNAVAVAVLADIACIILAEGAKLDGDAAGKAEENNIAVLESPKPAYELACGIYDCLGK